MKKLKEYKLGEWVTYSNKNGDTTEIVQVVGEMFWEGKVIYLFMGKTKHLGAWFKHIDGPLAWWQSNKAKTKIIVPMTEEGLFYLWSSNLDKDESIERNPIFSILQSIETEIKSSGGRV